MFFFAGQFGYLGIEPTRFTVTTRTAEGESAESEPSVAIRPNEPLPEGWKEIFNATTGKVSVVKTCF